MKNINLIIILFIIVIIIGIIFIYYEKINSESTQLLTSDGINQNIIKTSEPLIEESSDKNLLKINQINGDYLLELVDKQHCLSADYIPSDLVNIYKYNIPSDPEFLIREIAITDLKKMIDDAKSEEIDLKVISAYRSYQKQVQVYNSWVKKLGVKEANRQSAPAGCSQHQLGTVLDFNKLEFSFADTPAGIWLSNNGYKYGWVISYPINSEEITGYAYEPWHYRYIGIDNALKMKESGLILSKFLEEEIK